MNVKVKKAETNERIIFTIGIILAFLILFGWFIRSFIFGRADIDSSRVDLNKLQYKINRACGSEKYVSNFNPLLSYGNLTISNYSICFNTELVSECRTVICNLNQTQVIFLDNVTYININKIGNFIKFLPN